MDESNFPAGLITGLERRRLPGDGIEIDALVGGSGPPLLLLHGYPQSRLMWKTLVPVLLPHFTLVVPDLRGYGRSDAPPDPAGTGLYSKRVVARDQIATMNGLGWDRFYVAGHDRGARAAYRMAFDHPAAVEKLAVIDVVPTAEVFQSGFAAGMNLFHWSFLSQPHPLPEQLLEGRGALFVRHLFERWTKDNFHFDPEALQDYLFWAGRSDNVHATCADYRAAWHHDQHHDREDLECGKITCPVRVIWGNAGATGGATPLDVWRNWAENCSGLGLPTGHFVPEEAPEEVAQDLIAFFNRP